MAIRYAKRDDVGRCVELIRESYDFAGFEFPFIENYARSLFFHHISNEDAMCIVLELKGQVQGLLLAAHKPHPLGAGKVACETLWWISKAGRGRHAIKMLNKYEEWARKQGCGSISMVSLAGHDVSKLYERVGYKPLETHHIKVL